MLTRRAFCSCALGAVAFTATEAAAEVSACSVFTPQRQQDLSPDDALALLKAGNERFVSGQTINCDLLKQVHETAENQSPFAAIVGCIDSRVPPELVFDQRLGDVFCARVAGNFANIGILGSLEFATQVAGAKAIVVLGHNSCGAVKAAIDGVEAGNITAMLENIRPALSVFDRFDKPWDSSNEKLLQGVAEENVRLTARSITERSSIIRTLVESGTVAIATAMHDLSSGKVSWLDA